MSLRRQIFISFLLVAILPLIAVSLYMYQTNVRLAFDLYEQNLYNATEIQTDVISDHVRNFMVLAGRFAASPELEHYLSDHNTDDADILTDKNMAAAITKFTDNTLDSVLVFAIIDANNNIVYESGSNTDSKRLAEVLKELPSIEKQTMLESPWGDAEDSLILATPIVRGANQIPQGMFVSVYSNDYLLKTISSHKQIESSNSFIYCMEHQAVVKSKQEIVGSLPDLVQAISGDGDKHSSRCSIEGVQNLFCSQSITQTPWILVNSIPVRHIYWFVFSYALVSIFVLIIIIGIVLYVSHRQSKHILLPLNQLLETVENFFLSGGKVFTPLTHDKKTEIGYLGDKFIGLAVDIAATQNQLNESNYLYEALLHATYDMRVSIDFTKQELVTSSMELRTWFNALGGLSVAEKLIKLFEMTSLVCKDSTMLIIDNILNRNLRGPLEFEISMDEQYTGDSDCWYRIIAVPIMDEQNVVLKVVFHFEDITIKKCEELRLVQSSQRDALCGLLNKKTLLQKAGHFVRGRYNKNVVFFIDLDNFKQVNDTLGHSAGDSLLVKVGRILTEQFRETDLVSRYGGDEFVVFLAEMTMDSIQQKAETLLQELDITMDVPGDKPIHVTASIGVYIAYGTPDPETMIKHADEAMYNAKQKGKFQYCIWEEDVGDEQ